MIPNPNPSPNPSLSPSPNPNPDFGTAVYRIAQVFSVWLAGCVAVGVHCQSLSVVMPSLSATTDEAPPAAPAPATKPAIGIIYPPPEVRNIVDKTASFVARNGPEFETRIRQNEINNPKFNFLTLNDPYHAYYRHKVYLIG